MQSVRVGEEPKPQSKPKNVFVIVQFVRIGLSLLPMTTPPFVPPVTVTPESVAPVRSPHTVPSSTVTSAPAPRMLPVWTRVSPSTL